MVSTMSPGPQRVGGSPSRPSQVLSPPGRPEAPQGCGGFGGQASGRRQGRALCLSFPIDRLGVGTGILGGTGALRGWLAPVGGCCGGPPRAEPCVPPTLAVPSCAKPSRAVRQSRAPAPSTQTQGDPSGPGAPVTLGHPYSPEHPYCLWGKPAPLGTLWAPFPSGAPQTLGASPTPQLLGACQF